MRYPWLFEKLDRYEHSLLVPQPKKMPKALRQTLTQEAGKKPEVETIVVLESDSEWGEWVDPSKKTLETNASGASPSGDHQGAFPVGQTLKPVPESWKDDRLEVWNKHTELIQLGERETAYLSEGTVLCDRANDLLNGALLHLETAESVSNVAWPLPLSNPDGTKIRDDDEHFTQVRWIRPQEVIVGGAEKAEDPDHDGFVMQQQFDAQYFETDRYQEFPGYLGRITAKAQGEVHQSGLQIMSLEVDDIVVYSFSIARNVSDEMTQSFTEDEYSHFAIGQKIRKLDSDVLSCGLFDTRKWEDATPTDFKPTDTVYQNDIPNIVVETFEKNDCQISLENYDLLTMAAAGLLPGCNLQDLNDASKEDTSVGDNWHRGLLTFLGAQILPMIRTAFERAPKEVRSAFIHKIELDIGKQRPTAEGDHELVFPGDKVGETCLKFVESNIFLPETRWGIGSPETKEEMADNRARAAISIEHI